MLNASETLKTMQDCINLLYASGELENHAMLKAQKLGIQGEKRREGHDERKELCLMQHLQRLAMDVFDTELYPVKSTIPLPTMSTIQEYLQQYLAKLTEVYDKLHEYANALVVLKYRPIAAPMYAYVDYIWCEIIDIRRQMKEFALAGYEYHHVSRYQVGYENRHDDYEGKERDQGYKY